MNGFKTLLRHTLYVLVIMCLILLLKVELTISIRTDTELATAKDRNMTAIYEMQKAQLETEDALILSEINRQRLKGWLMQNGLTGEEADRFMKEAVNESNNQ